MKHPTLRKLRNRNLIAVRYHTPPPHSQVQHGWIIEQGSRGSMIVRLVGEDRNRRLSCDEARYVKPLGATP